MLNNIFWKLFGTSKAVYSYSSYDFPNLHEFSANIYILLILVLAVIFPSLVYKGLSLWDPVIMCKDEF